MLVVDDERINREILSRMLSRNGHDVLTADSGEAALERLEEQLPDLVLLDVIMSGMSGFDVLKTIRSRYPDGALPVIMVTAEAERENVVRAFTEGANDYLTKPLDPQITLARISLQLKLSRALSELNLYSSYKRFPDELEKSIVLSDVKMTYNEKVRGYLSSGPIGVGNILKTEIFRYFGGESIIQIKKQRGGDLLDIYLEADGNTWYYFTFNRGTMLAVSSNDQFNKELTELKSKSKKMDVERGPSYRFDVTNKKKKDQFLSKLKQMGALGVEEKKEEE